MRRPTGWLSTALATADGETSRPPFPHPRNRSSSSQSEQPIGATVPSLEGLSRAAGSPGRPKVGERNEGYLLDVGPTGGPSATAKVEPPR